MRVSYNSGLWSRGKGPFGVRQRTNWYFEFDGTKRCIPAVYRFSRGIVFDLITFLDKTKVREFYEKYGTSEEKLTPTRRRTASREHPYQTIPVKEIWINGRQVRDGYSSSSGIYIPWMDEGYDLAPVKKAYSDILQDTACFGLERYCVPYPEASTGMEKFLRRLGFAKVKGLKLTTYPVQHFYPLDILFDIASDEKHKTILMTHPITGNTHILYFQDAEIVKFPLYPGKECSFYLMQAVYEIEPALPKGDTLEFNSTIQYTQSAEGKQEPENNRYRRIGEKCKLPDKEYILPEASSIGIIGGASGPTAIFAAIGGKGKTVPVGEHGLPLNICFSVPGFSTDDVWHFALDGINIQHCDSKEYCFGTHIIR